MSIENNNNIIVPANVITELAKALQEDRNSQRAHEMAAVTAILAFTMTAADKLIGFAKEEAQLRRADRTSEHLSLIEGLSAQVEKLTADNDRLQADLILSRQRPLSRAPARRLSVHIVSSPRNPRRRRG